MSEMNLTTTTPETEIETVDKTLAAITKLIGTDLVRKNIFMMNETMQFANGDDEQQAEVCKRAVRRNYQKIKDDPFRALIVKIFMLINWSDVAELVAELSGQKKEQTQF